MSNAGKGQIEFPCPWELRVIAHGEKAACVRDDLVKLLVADDQVPALADGNSSAGGKYSAFRLTITVRDRQHLDAFCRSVAAIDGVKMVL